MSELGYSDGYKYPHDYPGHYIAQQYLPDTSMDETFFIPADTDKVQKRQK
jgi:putative ATPase